MVSLRILILIGGIAGLWLLLIRTIVRSERLTRTLSATIEVVLTILSIIIRTRLSVYLKGTSGNSISGISSTTIPASIGLLFILIII